MNLTGINLPETIFIVLLFIFNILLHKCLNKWFNSHYYSQKDSHYKSDSHDKDEFKAAYNALHVEGDCDKCYEILSRNI